jgi:hypothetical protein
MMNVKSTVLTQKFEKLTNSIIHLLENKLKNVMNYISVENCEYEVGNNYGHKLEYLDNRGLGDQDS